MPRLCIGKAGMGFLVRNAYALTALWVFLDQLGLPLPSAPALLAAGALGRAAQLRLIPLVVLASVASAAAHLAWFEAGRRGGRRILKALCQISLEPDACVRSTENLFIRHGTKSLLLSNFIPGLGIVAQPLAAMAGVSRWRFLSFNLAGSFLWAAVWAGAGYAIGPELQALGNRLSGLGAAIAVLISGALVFYLGTKLWQRRRTLHDLRMARITADELKRKLDGGEPVVIVDLRHQSELDREPEGIPGALRILPEDIEVKHVNIPRGNEVVLYCT